MTDKTEGVITAAPEPVKVSGNAVRDLTKHLRTWSGWDDATLVIGKPDPKVSPFAMTEYPTHKVTLNADALMLNPNRVLRTINPFRLRQEAVITGVLLHEAAHARYSYWKPRRVEDIENFKHSDGTTPSMAVIAFASMVDEARIEGRMTADAKVNGAKGLDWTLRASALYLLPNTDLSYDPATQIMQVIESWVLRAGRQIAYQHASGGTITVLQWVHDFTSIVVDALVQYLPTVGSLDPYGEANRALNIIRNMIRSDSDSGPFMIDEARAVLAILFPETPDDEMPQPGAGQCGAGGTADDSADSGDSGDSGDSEGEDSTSASAGDDESDEQDSEAGEGQSEGGGTESEDSETLTQAQANALADLQALMVDIEWRAEAQAKGEVQAQPKAEPVASTLFTAGTGGKGIPFGTWRNPTVDEREVQRNASAFLRDLIDPTENTVRSLTETPSAMVDGAALSAWKAAGQVTDPMFFIRTRREVTPSPPVKIAVLVDISGSMDAMQKPSALLSWALSSAAFDLRNFAGRGSQVSSTLIHWGDNAAVIQPDGQALPGIRSVPCDHGTDAMGEALALVEEQMPGFFDISDKPENRLIVQFTDWRLSYKCRVEAQPFVARAMEAGVNMLSVVPWSWTPRWSDHEEVMGAAPVRRGVHEIVKYNDSTPDMVWTEARKVLGR